MKFMLLNKKEHKSNKLIVTTSWDDGSVSDVRLSNLLEKYSLKGTFYVSKSYRWLENPLTVSEIIGLDKKHEIGAHTLTHPDLDRIGINSAKDEIFGSKDYIENLLGHDVEMFSYPRGRYNDKILSLVENAGFMGARTCNLDNLVILNNLYKCPITLQASNGSPLQITNLWISNHLSIKSLINWEIRAKELFDLKLKFGGIYHLWGHSSEIAKNNEWDKLERVFKYISNKKDVKYLSNGELLRGL